MGKSGRIFFLKPGITAKNKRVALSKHSWQSLRGPDGGPLSQLEAGELVFNLLAQLSPSDRLILTLLYLEGCTMAEAANRAGWTLVGARVRAFRARIRLKNLIAKGEL